MLKANKPIDLGIVRIGPELLAHPIFFLAAYLIGDGNGTLPPDRTIFFTSKRKMMSTLREAVRLASYITHPPTDSPKLPETTFSPFVDSFDEWVHMCNDWETKVLQLEEEYMKRLSLFNIMVGQ